MNLPRRSGLVLTAVFLIQISLFMLPVCAESARNSSVAAFKSGLEAKYGLKISGEGNLLTGKDAMSYLTAYDNAMSLFGAPFIRELVGLFEKTKTTTTVRFSRYTGDDDDAFDDSGDDGVVIGLLVESPYPGKPTMGIAPEIITHEIGHMIYYGISRKYGVEEFERDWTAINEGYPYRGWEEEDFEPVDGDLGWDEEVYDEQWDEEAEDDQREEGADYDFDYKKYEYIYVSEYAATDGFEDFAEIIAHILTESERIHELIAEPKGAVLKAKVDFIEKMVKKYFTTFKGYSSWSDAGAGAPNPTRVPTVTLPAPTATGSAEKTGSITSYQFKLETKSFIGPVQKNPNK